MNADAVRAETALTPTLTGLRSPVAARRERADGAFDLQRVWWATVLAVLLLQAVLVVKHEGWSDEWQALLIATTPTTLGGMLESLHYEGHPPLWYLLLRGFGSLLPLAAVLPTAQLCIALANQSLILAKLPMRRAERLMVSLSYFVMIEMGTVARGLSLGLLLLVTFFAVRRSSVRWAAVVLMPLVEFQFGLLSLVALACLWRDGDRSAWGVRLWFASSVVAAMSIIPAPDVAVALQITSFERSLGQTVDAFSALLVPLHLGPKWMGWAEAWPPPLGGILGGGFLLLGFQVFRQSPLERALYYGFLVACLAFSVFVYPFGVRHLTLVPLLMILLVTRVRAGGGEISPLFRGWLALSTACGLAGAGAALLHPFDSSKQAAEIIRARGLQDQPWISWPDSLGLAVAGNLQREMISIEKGCTFAFHRWNQPQLFRPERPGDAVRLRTALQAFVKARGTTYVVTPIDLSPVLHTLPALRIAHVPRGLSTYEFYLYELPGNGLVEAAPLPGCDPADRHRLERSKP